MADFGASAILPSLIGSLGGTILGSILGGGGGESAPAAPTLPALTSMPVADDAAVRSAQKKSIAAQRVRKGRSSTILSDQGGDGTDTLGG